MISIREQKSKELVFSSKEGNESPRYNIFKFFHVSDSSTINNPAVYDVVSVMAKDGGSYEYHKKNRQTVRTYLETIGSGKMLESRITTNYDSKKYSRLNF